MKKIALIPAYCPDQTLIKLIQQLQAINIDPVVVNDGSPEEYNDIFAQAEMEAVVLQYAANAGKGAAMKTGMQWIREHVNEEYVIVTVDADGQHRPEDADRCIKEASLHMDSLILGTRNFDQENVPFKSRYGNKMTEKIFWLCTGIQVHDTQTGLRAFHKNLTEFMLKVDGNRYEYEMNVLLACVENHIPIVETEIETVYEAGNPTSHFHVLRDSFRIYKPLLKFALSSFTGFLLDYGLFILFTIMFQGIQAVWFCNVLARMCSACFNYEVNRSLVFKDRSERAASFWKYMALAGSILLMNTMILSFLVYIVHMNAYLAKVITEMCLFVFSWTVQRTCVFPMRKGVDAI